MKAVPSEREKNSIVHADLCFVIEERVAPQEMWLSGVAQQQSTSDHL